MKRERVLHAELIALAGMNEKNAKKVAEAYQAYRDHVLPGDQIRKEKELADARAFLADAVKKAFLVTPSYGKTVVDHKDAKALASMVRPAPRQKRLRRKLPGKVFSFS